jgi:MMPL family
MREEQQVQSGHTSGPSDRGSIPPARTVAGRAAHWSATHRKTAIFGWLALVVVAVAIGRAAGQETIFGADQFTGEAGRAEHTLEDAGLRPNDEVVLVQSEQLTIDDPEFRATLQQTADGLSQAKDVVNVQSPLDGDGAVSADRHSALVEFDITGDALEARDRLGPSGDAIDAVQAQHPDLRVEQFGNVSSNKELNEIFQSDLAQAEALSLPITLLILVIVFGSLVAAGVPLLLAITCVVAAMSLVALPSHLSPVSDNISSVILLIGLAVGVDYSLFYLRRWREERAAGRSTRDALEVAAATSGRAVLISGLTVMVAMSGMFLTGDKTFVSFAEGTILVVAIAMVASLTVLPALLSWLGDRIDKGRIPFLARRQRPAGESRFWPAMIDRVMRRPWLSIALAGGALLALAVPALSMNIVNTSTDDLPQDLEVIKTYNRVRDAFPEKGVTASVAIEADNVRSGSATAGISLLQRRASNSDSVLPGTEVNYSRDGTVAEVVIPTVGNGNDDASNAALDEIRDDMIPATIGQAGRHRQRQRQRRRVQGLRRPAQRSAAADLRLRLRAHFPAAARHLPLDRDPDQGDPAQPALRGRGLWRTRARLPGRAPRIAARLHLQRRRHQLAAAVPVRDPVRALDGLPRLHPLARARGLRRRHEHDRGRPPRDLHHGVDRHQRRLRHGVRLLGLRHPQLHRLQGDGRRARGGRADRRDHHPRRAAAGDDEGARRLELVSAEVARVAAAHQGRGQPSISRHRRRFNPMVTA